MKNIQIRLERWTSRKTTSDLKQPGRTAQPNWFEGPSAGNNWLDSGSSKGGFQSEVQHPVHKWGQTPINLSELHNQIGVTGSKFGKDGAFRSITAVACNGPCMLQCYM